MNRILCLQPLLLYLGLSMAMTWPLMAQLGTKIPADVGNDVWVHEWTFWWLKEALLAGHNPYFTSLLFHPSGVELTSHNIAWVNFAVWLPLQALFGSNAAFSLMYPLFFTLNAFAMYLFANEQLPSRAAAVIAGLIFGFWPYTLSQGGHPNMIVLFGLPLGLLYLDRALKDGGWQQAALAGLFFAIQAIARWQLLVPTGYVAGIFIAYQIATQRSTWRVRTVRQLAITGGVMFILMMPLVAPLVAAQLMRPASETLLTYESHYASDLLRYFVPHEHLWFWSPLALLLPDWAQFEQQEILFLGYTVIALVMVSLYSRPHKVWLWLMMALWLWIAALGSTITIGHQPFPGLPTPYRWVEDWSINQFMRRPDRFNSMLGLPVGMLAAMGIAFLRTRTRLRAQQFVLLSSVIGLLIVAEYNQAPYLLTTTEVPKWYQQLAQEPDNFAILGIPIGPYFADKYYMHYQILHGKPLVGGHVSRRPPEALVYMDDSTFLDDMLERRIMNPAVGDVSNQLRYLAEANVRYVILHKHFSTDEQIADWKTWLMIEPHDEDDDVVVYSTLPKVDVDFTIQQQLTEQLGVIRTSISQAEAQQGDLISVDIGWAAREAIDQDYAACIHLIDDHDTSRQSTCHSVSPEWPTAQWRASEVVRTQFILRVDPHLPAGLYRAELTLQEPTTKELVGQPVLLAALPVNALPRVFTAPQPQHVTDLQLGDDVALLGYNLAITKSVTNTETNTGADHLQLTLYWQARQPITRSYKVFVHLTDSASGTMLAQSDAPPRQWAYPTTWWEQGEVVAEVIELPLARPLDELALFLGMYDEETAVRLPIQRIDGTTYPDDAYPLELQGVKTQ